MNGPATYARNPTQFLRIPLERFLVLPILASGAAVVVMQGPVFATCAAYKAIRDWRKKAGVVVPLAMARALCKCGDILIATCPVLGFELGLKQIMHL